MTDDFFPSEDYKIPVTSNYMKFGAPGEYTFRVLSSAIVGWMYFNTDNKPVRLRENVSEIPDDMKHDGNIKHFWAFVVWNYEESKVQILEITQKSLMTPIQALTKKSNWGNPKGYDITVIRKGTTINDTEYSVMPNPHSDVTDEINNAYASTYVNLEALFDGEDPFKK